MKEEMENEISGVEPCYKDEAEAFPRMCEIRFDALIKMYDMGVDQSRGPLPFRIRRETPREPQWFKSTQRMSLDAIKHGDEYSIGRMIKDQFRQMEIHISQYEQYGKL